MGSYCPFHVLTLHTFVNFSMFHVVNDTKLEVNVCLQAGSETTVYNIQVLCFVFKNQPFEVISLEDTNWALHTLCFPSSLPRSQVSCHCSVCQDDIQNWKNTGAVLTTSWSIRTELDEGGGDFKTTDINLYQCISTFTCCSST